MQFLFTVVYILTHIKMMGLRFRLGKHKFVFLCFGEKQLPVIYGFYVLVINFIGNLSAIVSLANSLMVYLTIHSSIDFMP